MHPIQEKIFRLAKGRNIGDIPLRKIGELIGGASPQQVKHHIGQLEKKRLLKVDKNKRLIELIPSGQVESQMSNAKLLLIPILGVANAGPATALADENIEGNLMVSSNILNSKSASGLFALRVSGPSMNQAKIGEKVIEDGDYVVVDRRLTAPNDRDIVVSIINGMANIKRFRNDPENNQIVLLSESSQFFPPIYIHPNDDYLVNGKVVQVIKKPKF